MRKILLVFLIIFVFLIVFLITERVFGQASFGPSAMIAITFLVVLISILLITFFLFETRFKEAMVKMWMMIISISITYLFVDIAAGYFLNTPLSPQLVPDEYRHHKLVPNTSSYFEQPDFSYIHRVNNFGLRGADIQVQKSPERYRILMLGDSFTMGKGVEDNQTFSVLVEDTLNKLIGENDGKKIEVLNAGVDSYAPVLSYIQLTGNLAPLEPDMVIHNFDVSDLLQEVVYRKEADYDSTGQIIGVPGAVRKLSFNDKIRDWTERHLYLTRFILYYTNKLFEYKEFTVRRIVTQANYEIAMHTLAQDTVQRDSQWNMIFDSIQKIKEYCANKSIDYILTIYPWGHQVNEKEWIPGRYNFIAEGATISDKSINTIKRFATDSEIELIDLYPLFRSYEGEAPLYFDLDPHITITGHQLIAKGISQYLHKKLLEE